VNSGGTRSSKEAIFKNVLSEVELLKKLDHPNIVKYLDLFAENGKVYVVLEALVATNLRALITETGAWSEDLILTAGIECCSILGYLHNRPVPIIHRDFTPDNLILDVDTDTIKLIDFNVAEEANAQISETIVGKQSFMAPEQWCGQFTTSGDLYQLGCTMYFLATASEPEALTQADPQTPSVSNELREIIRKLTERDPDDRYKTSDELAQDLKALQNARERSPAGIAVQDMNSGSRELTR
jgi:serine/threonine protein kinase